MFPSDTRAFFEQKVDDGHECWKLRPLQGGFVDVNGSDQTGFYFVP